MPEFSLARVEPRPYLFVQRRTAMDPVSMSEALGDAFGTVIDFLEEHGIDSEGAPIAVYFDYAPDGITFHAGVLVEDDDAASATGEVRAGRTPAGTVLHFTHVGPYASLSQSYAAMTEHCAAHGLTPAVPTWEIYVDDPDTTPADRLRTDVYVALA